MNSSPRLPILGVRLPELSLPDLNLSDPGQAARRADLDWLRLALFGGLIFYHEGLLYEPAHRVVSLLLLATHPWRMSLLFFISGAATRFMTSRLTPPRLWAERSLRLLPPLVFAALALVPVQVYLALVEGAAYAGGFVAFLKHYFAAPTAIAAPGQLPVYGHMWFVFYLWVYTVILAGMLAWRPGWVGRGEAVLARLDGMALLLVPYAVLVVLRLTLYPSFGVSLAFVNDWYNHLVSAGMFVLGFLAARCPPFWAAAVRMRWAALIMAAAGFALYSLIGVQFAVQPEAAEAAHPVMGVFHALEQWGAMIAVLGFGRRHLTAATPAPAYLSKGVFTWYIVHEPAMLAAWHWLKPLAMPDGLEAALVAAATLAVCVAAYEASRRVGWLGVVLGQRRLGWPAAWRGPSPDLA
jgi:hypothetical protein